MQKREASGREPERRYVQHSASCVERPHVAVNLGAAAAHASKGEVAAYHPETPGTAVLVRTLTHGVDDGLPGLASTGAPALLRDRKMTTCLFLPCPQRRPPAWPGQLRCPCAAAPTSKACIDSSFSLSRYHHSIRPQLNHASSRGPSAANTRSEPLQ